MQLLLRKITYDSNGVPEYADSEVVRGEIVIGTSPRSDIQLLDSGIAPVHARFVKSEGQLRLLAEKGRSFLCNGEKKTQAAPGVGDEIRIGAQNFHCVDAPAGFDLALEWHYAEMPDDALANAYRTSLSELRFSPRKVSWLLALTVLLVTGIAPMVSYFWQAKEPPTGPADQGMAPHSLWLSGPLLPAHEVAIGKDCAVCHQSPFEQVRNGACQQCHASVVDHVPPGHESEGHPELAARLEEFACQNCHKEHNEPRSIVSRSDGLCLDCHRQMSPTVAGFSREAHPAFALSLLRPEVERKRGAVSVNWQREKIRPEAREASDDAPSLEGEKSHLKYPHDIHLDPEAVKHPRRGDALQCVDCHTLSPDREHFEPVSMEKHCASCHDLSFDPRNPQKQLPHGSPEAVYSALEAHFVRLAFSPDVSTGFERRRRPGQSRTEESCDEDYDCAKQKAEQEAARQFSQRGCVTCHQVSEMEGAEGPERWQVLPVKINHDWYVDARFDHQSHLTQSDQTGDALCLTCHEADTSEQSSDILIPAMAQCTSCHGDRADAGRVALDCVSCHDYHRHGAGSDSGAMAEFMQGVNDGNW